MHLGRKTSLSTAPVPVGSVTGPSVLITIDEGMYEFEVRLCEVSKKVDLNTSVIITKLREVSRGE